MRIVMVTNQFPPEVIGGTSFSAAQLAAALKNRGHDVYILTGRGPSRVARTLQVNVKPLGASRRLLDRADIVHLHSPLPACLYSVYKGKLVTSVHTTMLHEIRYDPSAAHLALIPEFLTLRGCRRLAAVSNGIRSELVRWYGIEPDKITIIPNGIERRPILRPSKNASAIRILAVGRLVNRKAFSSLIRAMRIIVDKHPTVTLTLVGGGKLRNAIRKQIDVLGLKANVLLHDFLSRADLLGLYCAADIFVIPSMYEGHPLVLLEALAGGLPVIGSRIESHFEIVRDGENGLLFEAGNSEDMAEKICKLIENATMREKMARASFEISQQLPTWDYVAGLYEKLYES